MRPELPRRLRAQLAISALNFKFQGWRIFATSTGRLQATTITEGWCKTYGCLADAVDADSPRELAAKLTARSAQ